MSSVVRVGEAKFGVWELAAAVAVAAVLGGVAGTVVARVDSDAAVAPARTEARSVKSSQHIVRERTVTAGVQRGAAAAWLNAAALRNGVADVSLRDHAAVGVAVRSLATAPITLAGNLTIGSAWSTIKVPLVLARYRLADVRHENRTTIDRLAALALTESDNAAAAELFSQIEDAKGGLSAASRYVSEELRAAGDRVTAINTVQPDFGPFSTYGQTQWSLAAGTTFYRQLARACVPPREAITHVLALMGSVTPSQRWGIGAVTWAGARTVRFKGGWGPDRSGNYLVRQFGIVESANGRGFVVGLMAQPGDGLFGTGVHVLDDLAAAVARSTKPAAAPIFSRCR